MDDYDIKLAASLKKSVDVLRKLLITNDVLVFSPFVVYLVMKNNLVGFKWDTESECFISTSWDGTTPYLLRLDVIDKRLRMSHSLEHPVHVGLYRNPHP